MTDDLDLPAFLDRKLTPREPATKEEIRAAKAAKRQPKIVWPSKKNWRKIEERRREKQKLWDKGIV